MPGLDDAASELESIARHLRRAGETELVRELTRAIREAVQPVSGQIRAGLRPKLPDRYAAVLDADTDIKTSVATGERDPRVTIYAVGRGAVKRRRYSRLDGGIIEHPLWGDRSRWDKQQVTPGWFSAPCRDAAPKVREEIRKALEDVAAKAASKGA